MLVSGSTCTKYVCVCVGEGGGAREYERMTLHRQAGMCCSPKHVVIRKH